MFARVIRGVRRRIWQRLHPKHYWHMRHYDRRFALAWAGDWAEAFWRGRQVAASINPRDIRRDTESLAIVGSGPSLKTTSAAAWRGRDIACVNGSVLWAIERGLRPKFYVVTDPGFARRQLEVIRAATAAAETVCLTVRCLFEVLRQEPHLFLGKRLLILEHVNQPFGRPLFTHDELSQRPSVLIDRHRHYQNRYIIGVSTDLRLGIFPGGTVVLAAAQIGLAIGYQDIHFLGLDMKPAGSQARFYDERRPEPSFIDRNMEGLILPSFEVLKRYCDKHGVTLRNWSPDSAIPHNLVPAVRHEAAVAAPVG